jgi:hypothetical protein
MPRNTAFNASEMEHQVDEVLAIWYPPHLAFSRLRDAPSAAENFELKALAVEHGVIHRLSGFPHPRARGQ